MVGFLTFNDMSLTIKHNFIIYDMGNDVDFMVNVCNYWYIINVAKRYVMK